MQKLKVLVIFGGRSGEHEVSVISAQGVINALDKEKYEVVPLYITQEGRWLLGKDVKELTSGVNQESAYLFPDPKNNQLLGQKIDVVFPVLHGPFGEDGTIQGLLELTNLPYVGSGVLGSALGMDKVAMKAMFSQVGLPVVPYCTFFKSEIEKGIDECIERIENDFNYNVFVKPANLGSSVGISKAHNQKELKEALNLAASYDRKVIVEQSVENVREIEVSVLGNDTPLASCPGEIIPSKEFYDYEDKYLSNKSQLVIPAEVDDSLSRDFQALALIAYKAIDAAGLSRVDFLLQSETSKIYVNEINTIPGFTPNSMYPKLWEKSGISYVELVDKLIGLALERYQEKLQLKINR